MARLIILSFGMAIGATFLYIFGNYFLKDLIKEKFLNKFQNWKSNLKNLNLYIYLFIDLLVEYLWHIKLYFMFFNVKAFNFFFATLIGTIPQIFLLCSLGNGLEKVIEQNLEAPNLTELL